MGGMAVLGIIGLSTLLLHRRRKDEWAHQGRYADIPKKDILDVSDGNTAASTDGAANPNTTTVGAPLYVPGRLYKYVSLFLLDLLMWRVLKEHLLF